MIIASAFPGIMERQYPILKPDVPLLTALYFLKMKDMDAVPITYDDANVRRVVLGFSGLNELLRLGPKAFNDLLKAPCEQVSDELPVVGVDEEVGTLLDTFVMRKLGLALVREVSPGNQSRDNLISLTDFLDLYGTGTISSTLLVEDVGTPIFSMEGETPLRTALQAMFSHGYRRVFIEGEETYLSDRALGNQILSPKVIAELGKEGADDILSIPINKVKGSLPLRVPPRMSLKDAAFTLGRERGRCLRSGDKVVTPWDIVVKPWNAKRLKIG
jgi:hypothetical protein